jgi:adenine phosphoribosyltransferase
VNSSTSCPDFPKPGISFKDITPLLADGPAFADCIDRLATAVRAFGADEIAAPESRGFLFGVPVAMKLGIGFAPIRKKGQAAAQDAQHFAYALEYGTDTLCIHADAVGPGQRVVVIDDVLATGGTMAACLALIRDCGADVTGAAFLMELGFLDGRSKLGGVPVHALVAY